MSGIELVQPSYQLRILCVSMCSILLVGRIMNRHYRLESKFLLDLRGNGELIALACNVGSFGSCFSCWTYLLLAVI